VAALPGVQSVAFSNRMPLRGGWSSGLSVDTQPGSTRACDFQAVSPDYFATLGMPLLRGRLLTPDDRAGREAAGVVNQTFAREFFPDLDPIGRRLRRGSRGPWITIVGVVSDIRRGGKASKIAVGVYLSAAQTDLYPVRLADFAIRAAGDPRRLVNAVQTQVWSLDKDQPVTDVKTLAEIISASVAARRFQVLLLVTFATMALGIAVLGVFGVLSYTVSQRTREMGIRIALGADPHDILAMVLKQAVWLISAGVLLGLAGAYALAQYVGSLLFEVQPHDGMTYSVAVAALAATAIAASLAPARRGARVDPTVALRYE
jgi:putative ABC transport system permease protein